MYVFIFLVKVTEWPPIGKIAAHSAYDMFSLYKYLIVSLVFSHLSFWSGSLLLIAPFPDLCLLVPFSPYNWLISRKLCFCADTLKLLTGMLNQITKQLFNKRKNGLINRSFISYISMIEIYTLVYPNFRYFWKRD